MSVTTDDLIIDPSLEVEIQTDKAKTKMLPCVGCRRGCVVNQFKDPRRTVCTPCRDRGVVVQRDGSVKTEESAAADSGYEFNDELETEVLTDKEPTKEVPCSQCGRRCVVTLFKTAGKTRCNTCQGVKKTERREEVLVSKAPSISAEAIAQLDNLADAILNPQFKHVPLCPIDPDHHVELKYVCHNPNYGPRHLEGYTDKGIPRYRQETGEVVNYQCNDCRVVISYSTTSPMLMQAQNEARRVEHTGPSPLEQMLGVRQAA